MSTRTEDRNSLSGYLITLTEFLIVAISVSYAFTASLVLLVLWTVLCASYLVAGFFILRQRWTHPLKRHRGRVGSLDTLSWVLPLAASLSGVNSAVLVLIARGDSDPETQLLTAVLGSIGIVISWMMLHAGFAHVYEAGQLHDPDAPALVFPATREPSLVDFIYFSFTIGSSFATSDTSVMTQRMRLTVVVHNIVSFFYNAIVVAVAIQVFQQIADR